MARSHVWEPAYTWEREFWQTVLASPDLGCWAYPSVQIGFPDGLVRMVHPAPLLEFPVGLVVSGASRVRASVTYVGFKAEKPNA